MVILIAANVASLGIFTSDQIPFL